MKLILLTVFFSMLVFSCTSQRILQTSQKKIPQWISIPDENSIVLSTEAESDMNARSKIHSVIKNEITSRFYNRLRPINNFNSTICSVIESKSGVSSFFNNITLSNAINIYWQQVKRKDGLHYIYYCQYPFTRAADDSLTALWQAEAAIWKVKIDSTKSIIDPILSKGSDSYNSIPEMISDINTINRNKIVLAYSDSLIAESKESNLRNMLQLIEIESENMDVGQLRYRLLIDKHPILPNAKPSFKGCAKVKSLFNDTISKWQTIKYEYSECEPCDELLSINVAYGIDSWKYESKIPYNLKQFCVDFQVKDYVLSSYQKKKAGLFSSTWEQSLNLIINPIKPGAFKVTRIDYSYYQRGLFNVKNINKTFDNLNHICSGNSQTEISFTKSLGSNEEAEATGKYSGLITIFYIDLFKNKVLTKTIENQEIRINK